MLSYIIKLTKLHHISDEGLTLETSASESLYGGQFTLSTQLIKPNYLVILPPTQHHSFFRNLPPFTSELTVFNKGQSACSLHTYPKAVLGSSGFHLYPQKVRTNPQVLQADIRPPYWVSWRTGNKQEDCGRLNCQPRSQALSPMPSPVVWKTGGHKQKK